MLISENLTALVQEYCETGNQLGKAEKENKPTQVTHAKDQIETTLARMISALHDDNPQLDPGRATSETDKLDRKRATAGKLNELIWQEAKKTTRTSTNPLVAIYDYQPPSVSDNLKVIGRGRW